MRGFARMLCVAAGLALLLAASVATAAEDVNKDADNVAIKGYDTVSYFTEGKPIPGSPQYEHVWHDARWRFSSAENRDLFAREPERYAPRYGGFCAGAMTVGQKVTIDPEAWVIIDGMLYLSYAKRFISEFAQNAGKNIPKANANWQRVGQAN
jgi:hypothetical protein